MQTVYSLQNQEVQVSKGLVEIFDIYDDEYFSIFVDGLFVQKIDSSHFAPHVLKHSFVKKCCALAGVNDEELHFVLYDIYSYGETRLDEYEASHYQKNYQDFFDLVLKHGFFYSHEMEYLAHGITDFEAKYSKS